MQCHPEKRGRQRSPFLTCPCLIPAYQQGERTSSHSTVPARTHSSQTPRHRNTCLAGVQLTKPDSDYTMPPGGHTCPGRSTTGRAALYSESPRRIISAIVLPLHRCPASEPASQCRTYQPGVELAVVRGVYIYSYTLLRGCASVCFMSELCGHCCTMSLLRCICMSLASGLAG